MSFRVWFKRWVLAFFKLLTLGGKPYKSDAQRKKEHDRRMKKKFSHSSEFGSHKKRARRRSSQYVWFEKAMGALFNFAALSLGILFLPFGLFDWGHKSIKAKRASGGAKTIKSKAKVQTSKPTSPASKTVAATAPKKETKSHPTTVPQVTKKAPTEVKTASTSMQNKPKGATIEDIKGIPVTAQKEIPLELDENIPKSTPRNEKDQYIRKRMIIAGSSYCDKDILATLEIGTCFDVSLEPDNPHDKEAVMLSYNGQKIGYISKSDKPAFVTCLKLKRKVYGVITNINTETFPTQYEFETWFDSEQKQR